MKDIIKNSKKKQGINLKRELVNYITIIVSTLKRQKSQACQKDWLLAAILTLKEQKLQVCQKD